MERNVSAEDMLQFVQQVFKEAEDIETLTIREIRNSYLKKNNLEALTKEQRETLKTIIENVLLEFSSKNAEKKPSSNKEAAESMMENAESELQPEVNSKSPQASESETEDVSQKKTDDSGVEDEDNTDEEEEIQNKSSKSSKRKRVLIDSDSEESLKEEADLVVSRKPQNISKKEVNDSKIAELLGDSDVEMEQFLPPKLMKKFQKKKSIGKQDVPLRKVSSKVKSGDSSDSENEPLVAPKSKDHSTEEPHTDSEEEPLISAKLKVKNEKEEIKKDSSSDESIGQPKRKKKKNGSMKEKQMKKTKANENKPPKKTAAKVEENRNLKILRSCCHAAGLFVRYDKIFADCKSDNDKEKVLLRLLKEAGLKGNPTIEACKKLKLIREEKKALDDLDMSNIITTSGRPRRQSAYSAFKNFEMPVHEDSPKETVNALKSTYSRLVGIVDSEESNSD